MSDHTASHSITLQYTHTHSLTLYSAVRVQCSGSVSDTQGLMPRTSWSCQSDSCAASSGSAGRSTCTPRAPGPRCPGSCTPEGGPARPSRHRTRPGDPPPALTHTHAHTHAYTYTHRSDEIPGTVLHHTHPCTHPHSLTHTPTRTHTYTRTYTHSPR
jgi:hypothetical protein